jgi:hypothetical protein
LGPSSGWVRFGTSRGSKGCWMPCRPEPRRLAARQKGVAPLPAPQEARTFLLVRRGPGGA